MKELLVGFYWSLRIGVFFCFVGHGAFGFITKATWLAYYRVFGIPESFGWATMPYVGLSDVSLGFSALFWPCRAVLAYMVFWCTFTASLRPLAGQGMWEFWERAGNYGIPFVLLILGTWTLGKGNWFKKIEVPTTLTSRQIRFIEWCLRITISLLLLGHGGFGAFQNKKMLIDQLLAVGITPVPQVASQLLYGMGWLELILAVAVLFVRSPTLWALILVWKVATELLYPLSGDYVWEFIERFGDYVAPLALMFLFKTESSVQTDNHLPNMKPFTIKPA